MNVYLTKSRTKGKKLSANTLKATESIRGVLSMSTDRIKSTGEAVKVLRLHRQGFTNDVAIATLYGAELTTLGDGRMTFRGIENEDGTGYAQEWIIDVDGG